MSGFDPVYQKIISPEFWLKKKKDEMYVVNPKNFKKRKRKKKKFM